MNPGFLGRDVPVMDPGSDTSTFDGKLWNMNNNRLFRSRFEKYLNAPAETSEADLEYEKTINEILSLLSPGRVTTANVDAAWKLLPKASEYRSDANLCASMADVVYSVWLAKNEVARSGDGESNPPKGKISSRMELPNESGTERKKHDPNRNQSNDPKLHSFS